MGVDEHTIEVAGASVFYRRAPAHDTEVLYLHSVPTVGGDLDFEVLLALSGAALGLIAGFLMRVERDETTGQLFTRAGVAYAALWIIVLGGRLAFAWAATNVFPHQIMQFSIQHAITSSAAVFG